MLMATFNAKNLSTEEKVIELKQELEHLKWDIVGISEVRRGGNIYKRCRLSGTPKTY